MVAHFFREESFEKFLIPETVINDFDKLVEKMSNTSERSKQWYKLTDEFNDKYWQYKCEGELYDTKLFIESNKTNKNDKFKKDIFMAKGIPNNPSNQK